ncbi:MAG: DNA-processing protein DprA [Paludibacteraceae bacterium]|nr:DNA-processing protein DprA [Paludibacteraceae bacterium]
MTSPLYDIALSFLFKTRLRTALSLVGHYGSAQEAWRHLDEPGMEEAMERAGQEWAWINEHDIRVWTLTDGEYPYRLGQCPDRPLVLYGKGNLHPSDGHIVSIVGTRRPTENGKELTAALVRGLHERLDSLTIVSGGAYGIDITAHRTAIELGVPTIIVPAHGLDRIYPYQHRPEAVASLAHGGLLTEFPSGTEPFAANFVQRNRIIAGLADAVVVVESREKGGSLITARMAADYDRELFAFPGRPTDMSSAGCNNLIRDQKAQLVTSAEDLVSAMGWTVKGTPKQAVQTQMFGLMDDLTSSQRVILEKLQEAEEGMHINHLVLETALPYSDVASDLMMLEMNSLVRSLPGGFYRLVR